MLSRAVLLSLCPVLLFGAQEWILIRTTDGSQLEGQADLVKTTKFRPSEILSIHSGSPASEKETESITTALIAVQGKERQQRDRAVDELTAIGVPVLTPLLKTLKDTDQHEPRPLYRLFERIMPSDADGVDRSLSLTRLQNGNSVRGALPEGALEVRKGNGEKVSVPWSTIRSLAVRKKSIQRAMPIHSLRHCNQIEYLDTGVVTTPGSKLNVNAHGFVRLSWNEDGWASDPDGLKKPGSPAYKTNLVGGHPFGALIGRVGSDGEVFFLGKQAVKTNLPAGRVKLAVNDNAHWQNNVGTYSVTMTVTDAYDLGNPQ
ncbi:MAG TPA: hypothetical protein VEX68_20820 [Bryobacteraceae bacterium]|nr:hypothetical protein [Bryobacteraceae bacterium]